MAVIDFSELNAVVERVGGMPAAYGLRFHAGKPHTTLHFQRGEGVHLYVCVDKEYSPVSMALVHPPTPCVQYREVPCGGDECRSLVADLYGAMCRLAVCGRNRKEPIGQTDPVPVMVADGKPPSAGLVLPLLTNEGWKLDRAGAVSR